MRAFVTGGTGLIGRHLVEALLARGWDVTVLTRDASRARSFEARGVRIVEGDVTRPDFASEMAHSDVLFHLAAWFELGVRDDRRMFDVNVTGTANLLTLARREGVPRIVVTGTAGILAPEPWGQPITEASPPKDVLRDPYVVTKRQAFELVLGEMHAGRPITMVCPAGVFGPGDTGPLGRSLALLVRGKLTVLPTGFGRNTWSHAADVAEGHILAATLGKPGEVYLLGDRVLSLYDFYRAAAAAAGVRPPERRVPMALARMAARFSELRAFLRGGTPLLSRGSLELAALDVIVDSTKARTELGWCPKPFEDRMRETMAWYVATYADGSVPLPVKRGGASAGGPPHRAGGPPGR